MVHTQFRPYRLKQVGGPAQQQRPFADPVNAIPQSRTSLTHKPLKLMQGDVLGDQHGNLKIVAQQPSPLIT